MDVTMDMEVEHQIIQPEQQLTIMETCYEETPMEEAFTTEGVQTRSQAQKQGSTTTSGKSLTVLEASNCRAEELPRKSKLQVKLRIRLQVSIQQGKMVNTMAKKNLCIRDNTNLSQLKHLSHSLESILA